MRERDIEKYLKTNIEKNGGMCLKFVSPGKSGVPDRLCLLNGGIHFFVEVKAPGEKTRPLQAKCHREFLHLGHPVYIVDCKEHVDELIYRELGEIHGH